MTVPSPTKLKRNTYDGRTFDHRFSFDFSFTLGKFKKSECDFTFRILPFFFCVGFCGRLYEVSKKIKGGMRARTKFILSILISFIFCILFFIIQERLVKLVRSLFNLLIYFSFYQRTRNRVRHNCYSFFNSCHYWFFSRCEFDGRT